MFAPAPGSLETYTRYSVQVGQGSLAAACFECGWADQDKEATRLATEGKLYCAKCKREAKVVHLGGRPSLIGGRPEGAGSEGIPEAVHEGVAGLEESGAR